MEQITLTKISHEEFAKKVEVEAAYLMHYNNLDKTTAGKVAATIVQEKFTL